MDPRQSRVGLQHALGHLVCLITKHTEDAKVVHDETGKCHVAGMPTEARAPEVSELVAWTLCMIAAAFAARSVSMRLERPSVATQSSSQ